MTRVPGVKVFAGLALEAGAGGALDASLGTRDEVAGELGMIFDPLELDKFVFGFVVGLGLFVVFVGLALVAEPGVGGAVEPGVWVTVPEAVGGVEPEAGGGAGGAD